MPYFIKYSYNNGSSWIDDSIIANSISLSYDISVWKSEILANELNYLSGIEADSLIITDINNLNAGIPAGVYYLQSVNVLCSTDEEIIHPTLENESIDFVSIFTGSTLIDLTDVTFTFDPGFGKITHVNLANGIYYTIIYRVLA